MSSTRIDTGCFEKFLELFSQKYPENLHWTQMDNGRFHNSLNLNIPSNVILIAFLVSRRGFPIVNLQLEGRLFIRNFCQV